MQFAICFPQFRHHLTQINIQLGLWLTYTELLSVYCDLAWKKKHMYIIKFGKYVQKHMYIIKFGKYVQHY